MASAKILALALVASSDIDGAVAAAIVTYQHTDAVHSEFEGASLPEARLSLSSSSSTFPLASFCMVRLRSGAGSRERVVITGKREARCIGKTRTDTRPHRTTITMNRIMELPRVTHLAKRGDSSTV